MTALGQALVISYRSIGSGAAPAFVDPGLLRAQLDCLSDCGVQTLTVSELAAALEDGSLPPRAVTLTFQEGFRSVLDQAAPLLLERGFTATVFCVAGRLGGVNDWASAYAPAWRPLLSADEVAELSHCGFEIGSRGMEHLQLDALPPERLHREVAGSRTVLEEVTGMPVSSFAFPYGALPHGRASELVEATYSAACCGQLGTVTTHTHPYALPHVDAHYLRRAGVLRRALVGSFPPYLRVRRAGAQARRLLRPSDVVPAR